MSLSASAYLPAPDPDGPAQIDPGLVRLAITVMYLTTFFSLLGMGFPGEHALSLTVGAGLGSIALLDRFSRYMERRQFPWDRR